MQDNKYKIADKSEIAGMGRACSSTENETKEPPPPKKTPQTPTWR